MGRIRSDILFNRVLLWVMMAYVSSMYNTADSWTPIMFLALAVYNIYKSLRAWGTE